MTNRPACVCLATFVSLVRVMFAPMVRLMIPPLSLALTSLDQYVAITNTSTNAAASARMALCAFTESVSPVPSTPPTTGT